MCELYPSLLVFTLTVFDMARVLFSFGQIEDENENDRRGSCFTFINYMYNSLLLFRQFSQCSSFIANSSHPNSIFDTDVLRHQVVTSHMRCFFCFVDVVVEIPL